MLHQQRLAIPAWIWHPDREKRTEFLVEKRFEVTENIDDAALFLACTGSVDVYLQGKEAGSLSENPAHVSAFTQLESFPARLAPGEYVLRLHIRCDQPMPIHPINIHLHERSVGCIGFLRGSGLWIATDDSWTVENVPAAVVCRLGEEPYGDLDGGPEWFIAGGYGDIVAEPIDEAVPVKWHGVSVKQVPEGVLLQGSGQRSFTWEPSAAREKKHLFYHLLKQNEWAKRRSQQRSGDFEGAPHCLIRLGKEYNARLRISNRGTQEAAILWNGAESLTELTSYEACITEVLSVPAGATVYTLPQGIQYLQCFIGTEPGEPFSLEIGVERVGVPLAQIGGFSSDLPRLNQIYEIAAHTSLVCHQIGLWDGIKRDRLNWAYDVYLAAKSDYILWDDLEVLRRSFRELGNTPYGYWMNSIPSYTLWWISGVWEYFWQTGDKSFPLQMKDDLTKHIRWIRANVDPDTGEFCPELKDKGTFIEWSPIRSEESWHALNAIYALTARQVGLLSQYIPELGLTDELPVPSLESSVFLDESASLLTRLLGIMTGTIDEQRARTMLRDAPVKDPITPLSAFWMAECCSELGLHEKAWDVINTVWGMMIDAGATTFWESSVLQWEKDYHRAQTTYTNYSSYRISLCHSWASTPVVWISKYVLGLRPLAPGYAEYAFEPNPVAGIGACQGAVPTALGLLRAEWQSDGGQLTKRVWLEAAREEEAPC